MASHRQDSIQPSRLQIISARLLIGVIILICAEVFSGASLANGLWHPWTILLTYWLYFAHFFFFTTLAVRTGRTSLSSLYLWGVLFGLYESWITKVIWSGYGGDGKFVLGAIGPYGFSEISMVFIFHPVAAFLLPLAIACLLSPVLRSHFPDLAIFTVKNRIARILQAYIVLSLAPVMGVNSGGALNLAANLAVAIALVAVLMRVSRDALAAPDAVRIVAFGRRGFIGLCVYLAALYGLTYPFLRPECLPSAAIQAFTFVFYVIAIGGIWLQPRRAPLAHEAAAVEPRERRLVVTCFATMIGIAFVVSIPAVRAVVAPVVALNLGAWTLIGFIAMLLALGSSLRQPRRLVPQP